MFLDLDRFKSVNDSLGHPVGDSLLCAVTERLQRAVPGADTVARLGGDEFAIVQGNVSPTAASELAAHIIDTLVEPFDLHGHQVVIGTSHRHRHGAGRRQRARPALAQCRHGALSRQGGRPRQLSLLPAGNGRADAGSAQARARSAQGAARRSIRAVLSAGRRCRDRARSRASRRCCAGIIRSAAWCRPMLSFRSPRKSA